MIVLDRFWAQVVTGDPDGCWEWTGPCNEKGYGKFTIGGRAESGGKQIKAHRFAYEIRQGPVPEGLELDHLCRNRSCVNAAHLEPVTRRENQRRGQSVSGRNARKTHCKHGHEFTRENTRWRKDGSRYCRTCGRDRQKGLL